MSVISCPSCNTPAPPGAIFCDNCGYDLRAVAQPARQTLPPTHFASPAAGGEITCPACGHANIAGSVFCEECGTQLSSVAATPQPKIQQSFAPPADQASFQPGLAFVTGRLLLLDSNVSLPIPTGKQAIVLGREDPVSGIFPDIDLDPHGAHEAGVGRKHAQLVAKGGQVFLEDLDSVNGTVINKQKISPHQPHPIKDGDELRLGKLVIVYYAS